MNPRLDLRRTAAQLAAHPALHQPASRISIIDPARLEMARRHVTAVLDGGGQMAFDLQSPTREAA